MIRRMVLADSVRAAEIHVYGWRFAYRGIISEQILFNKINVVNRVKYFERAISDELDESYVFDDGVIKAILTIGTSRDKDKMDAYELWGIYVDPFMHKQGIGKNLVQFCEKKAMELGYKEVILWTFEKNVSAKNFYEYMGYQVEGKKNYIKELDAKEIRYSKTLNI